MKNTNKKTQLNFDSNGKLILPNTIKNDLELTKIAKNMGITNKKAHLYNRLLNYSKITPNTLFYQGDSK